MMGRAARILVVDDEPSIREIFCRFLAGAEYEVTAAEGGPEALEIIRGRKFDVALVDIQMPEINGVELLKKLKQADSSIEVILITGFSSLDTAIGAVKADAYDYLSKPVEGKEVLLSAVQGALEKRQALKARRQRHKFDKLPATTEDGEVVFLDLEDIYYCDASGHKAYAHDYDREHLTKYSLGELEEHLGDRLFLRVHRRYLVNMKKVIKVTGSDHQRVHLIVADRDRTQIPVSRHRLGELRAVTGKLPRVNK